MRDCSGWYLFLVDDRRISHRRSVAVCVSLRFHHLMKEIFLCLPASVRGPILLRQMKEIRVRELLKRELTSAKEADVDTSKQDIRAQQQIDTGHRVCIDRQVK
jgi:hypothetical protein